MHILPFDLFSARSLSIILLGLIVLVTQADGPLASAKSLASSGGPPAQCGNSYVPSPSSGFGCGSGRNAIQDGRLTVGTSF